MNLKQNAFTLKTAGRAFEVSMAYDCDKPIQNAMQQMLCRGQVYELETQLVLLRGLRPGDVFVDVGAHVGTFSVLASHMVGAGGHVYAFEPDIANHAMCVLNLEANGLKNWDIFPYAVSSYDGTANFWSNSDNDGAHCLWETGKHPVNVRSREHPQKRTVVCHKLSSVLKHSTKIRVLKIDTEGAEMFVLCGAEPWIKERSIPYIVAEVNVFGLEQFGHSPLLLRGLMENYGYTPYRMHPDGGIVTIPADESLETGAAVTNVLFSYPDAVEELLSR